MLRRLALSALLGTLCACDPPPRSKDVEKPAAREQKKEAEVALTRQQVGELSARCEKAAREQFRRAWKDGREKTTTGESIAEFRNHYNERLKTCFYLLTVASAGTLNKMLFDINGGELYGEYLGPASSDAPPAAFPKTCMVESLYCASGREWDVLVRPYMEN